MEYTPWKFSECSHTFIKSEIATAELFANIPLQGSKQSLHGGIFRLLLTLWEYPSLDVLAPGTIVNTLIETYVFLTRSRHDENSVNFDTIEFLKRVLA